MFKRFFTISLLLAITASFTMAQNGTYLLKPNGEKTKIASSKSFKEAIVDTKVSTLRGAVATSAFAKPSQVAAGLADTLTYRNNGGTWNTNFGMFGQDIMLQFFEAPADMDIKGIGFTCSDDAGAANATVSFRLVKMNWTAEQMKSFTADTWLGYYPSAADGMNNIDPFGEVATGDWVSKNEGFPLPPWTDNASPSANTFAYDLWSDGTFGWPVTPILSSSTDPVYSWIATADLGFEPKVVKGDVFAVVAVHDGITLDGDRIGFWSDNTLGLPGWKYYENGRLVAGDVNAGGDGGWWVRLYTWDMTLAVEFTSDRGPVISNITSLLTTVDTGPQTVNATITDDNPSGGNAGIAKAELFYSIDTGKTYQSVVMTGNGDLYSGNIPGQSPGTFITYKIIATDVEGLSTESGSSDYSIFERVNKELLVIFNGGTEGRANQLAGYYLQGLVPKYDLWAAYGPVSDFVNFYDAVLEISSENGPNANNQVALANYVALGGKTLGVVGQEVLGFLNGYSDSTFVAGDYEYDVLGVLTSHNDVSYGATGDEELPSQVIPLAGTKYGAPLAQWLTDNALDTLWYYPTDILGSANWMDQFDARTDIGSEVFMDGIALDGSRGSVGHSYVNGTSNVFFMSLDPLVLTSDSGWVGYSYLSPLAMFISDFIVSVEENGTLPGSYSLSQNYPNPFNPTTVISYSIPEKADVTLKVFNLLGQEVATLVNASQNVGSHEVNFNASNLTSGVYFYTIKAGDFTSTRKMMLIK